MYKLVIGDKALSSWSLRPWLVLKKLNIPFEEIKILLDLPDTKSNILKYNKAARVPVLIDGDITIWESLAICEYIAENNSSAWPKDKKLRAHARSICSEMHAGFYNMRNNLSSKFAVTKKVAINQETQAEIDRVVEIWQEAFKLSGSKKWLYGDFSIADAFYAPVAIGRFLAYGVQLPAFAQSYCDNFFNDPIYQEWRKEALNEIKL